MRQKRIIYHNDARHYYLFVFEPPLSLEDAWTPVDEVAGTAVDTIAYGIQRGDGLFYPSDVALQFGSDMMPFEQAAYWRTWHNMKSLEERGIDPLQLLIDRAHDKGMDFFATVRLGNYGGMDPAHAVTQGGRGLGAYEVRDGQIAIIEELVNRYPLEGVELDLAVPGGGSLILPEEADSLIPELTEFVAQISRIVRTAREGMQVGVRVLPTEELNLGQGLDVRAWLQSGSLDFVIPMRYGYMVLDPNMPSDWLLQAAHSGGVSFYGCLQPYVDDQITGAAVRQFPSSEQMRAAVANQWSKGVDGLYTWFMDWPLRDAQRSMLSEMGDPDLGARKDKQYVLVRTPKDDHLHYRSPLPIRIAADDVGTRHPVPFYIADDIEGAGDQICEVLLEIVVTDLVSADRLEILLNGESLQNEACRRGFGDPISRYGAQALTFDLRGVLPRKGDNLLEITLDGRASGLASPLVVREVKITVNYHPFPARL